MTDEQNKALLDSVNRLVGAIDAAIQRSAVIEEALCWHFLSLSAAELRAKADCREWIGKHLVKSRKKEYIRDLKAVAEHAGREHLTHQGFGEALSEAGFRVEGEFVFCTIT